MRAWLKKYDILNRALSVLIALVLWFYVVNVLDPVTDVEIKEISPVFLGSDELMISKNLMVTNQDDYLVSVVISGKRNELVTVDNEDIRVDVDLSKLKGPGVYTLPYTVILPSDDIKVLRKHPAQLEVKLDRVSTAIIPVKIAIEGSVAEGYMTGEPTSIPSGVSITGLLQDIGKISYAQVKVKKTDINTTISEHMRFDFYDSDGKLLQLDSVEPESETVEVNIPVLKVVDVPLKVDIVEGGGARGQNLKYKIKPEFITIAGEERLVDALDSIKVGVLDLSKIGGSNKTDFVITLPENIRNISGEVSAEVEYSIIGLKSKVFRTSQIEIINIPAGYSIEPVTNSIDVNIRGTEDGLSKLLPDNIHAISDLTATILSPGRHTIPAHIEIQGVTGVGAVGEYRIVVNVKKI